MTLRRPRLRELAAPASGLLLGLAQEPFPFSWIAFLALVPYLVAAEARFRDARAAGAGPSFRRELGRGYLLGLGYFGLMLYWIAFLPPEEMAYSSMRFPAAVAMVLYLSLYGMLFGGLFALLRLRGRVPLVVAAPVSWTTVEWLRTVGPLGFPWGSLGYAFAPHPVALQMAAAIGVLGLSAWIALVNALATSVVDRVPLPARARYIPAFTLVISVMIPLALGAFILARAQPGGSTARVALVQQNIGGVEKWRPDYKDWNLAILDSMTIAAGAKGVDVIIWPETAATAYLRQDHPYAKKVYAAVRAAGTPTIAGFLDAELAPGGKSYHTYNAAGLISPRDKLQTTYRKMHLVPFGEEMPFERVVPLLQRLDLGEADFNRGASPVLLEIGALRAGVLICFEAIFPQLGRLMVASGANLLVNITNDSWFGDSAAPHQHAAMAIVRAVELRRSIARCANTGISCLIDPWGRVTVRGGVFTREVLTGPVELREDRTLFARFGGLTDAAWPLAGAVLVLWSLVRGARTRRSGRVYPESRLAIQTVR